LKTPRRAARAVCLAAVTCAAVGLVAGAAAQTLDVGRPRTLVVGTPGGARAVRVDGARTGGSREPLPTGSLRVQWQAAVGAMLDEAPVVDASGTSYGVGTRGEVVAIARDGTERWHVSTGAVQPGPAALLSDDTLVFADALGEAVAVRNGAIRWRVRFGRGDVTHPAPLPLEDGGVIVATAHDLSVLDIDGGERARVTLPEVATGPLVAAGGKVIATGISGTVYTWTPGASEVMRAGSFEAAPEGGAVLVDPRTLVAVTAGGTRLTALDLVQGTTTLRGQAGAALWLGPPATHGGNLYLTLLGPTAELAVAFDPSGAELFRVRVAVHPPLLSPDGGAPALVELPHGAPLVDASGTFAFATTDGTVGTVTGTTVELVPGACVNLPATRLAAPADSGRISGIAPLGPGLIVAACHAGVLLGIGGVGGVRSGATGANASGSNAGAGAGAGASASGAGPGAAEAGAAATGATGAGGRGRGPL